MGFRVFFNSSPNFIPRGMGNMRNEGIPGVLRSNYFCDFVDVEGKKEVIIPRPNNIECHCIK